MTNTEPSSICGCSAVGVVTVLLLWGEEPEERDSGERGWEAWEVNAAALIDVWGVEGEVWKEEVGEMVGREVWERGVGRVVNWWSDFVSLSGSGEGVEEEEMSNGWL